MALTPGVRFLIKTGLPNLFGPPLLVHALLVLVSQFWFPLDITPSILICVYLFSFPAYFFTVIRIGRIKEYLAARRLGAQTTPRVEGFLPANIDLLYKGFSADKTEYFGEPWLPASKALGTTFSIQVLGDQRFCTLNPQNVQKVLATDFDHYHKGKMFDDILEPMLGTGIFNSDGAMWQFHRKMTRPFFSKERVTDLVLYEKKAAIAIQKMQERFDEAPGMAVDFQDLISRFTLDSATEFLLGSSVNSLDSPLPFPHNMAARNIYTDTASNRFARAFAAAQVLILTRVELGVLWPLAEIFEDKMKAPMEVIKSFIDPIVRSAIAKREQGGGDDKDDRTLLGHLLDITDDIKVIVDETLNIMLAGRDTTACLLTFVTYCLAMYPNVLSRLRNEILTTVGSVRSPSYDELREMKYLRAILNETLRLFPPVPFNPRETTVESLWLDDKGRKLYLPANARVALSYLHLHRHEDYWGPDAHIYDPDRWLDDRVRHYTSNPFIFVPFHGGPRICIGQQFAYHETSFFLVKLLQHFETFELAPECQPPKTRPPESWKDPASALTLGKRRPLEQCFPRAHLTMYVDGGLWLRAKRAVQE